MTDSVLEKRKKGGGIVLLFLFLIKKGRATQGTVNKNNYKGKVG
jgi:hypothetical protein